MPDYLVTWQIDIDADDPVDAAMRALAVQRDGDSIAEVFLVRNKSTGETTTVDLTPDED